MKSLFTICLTAFALLAGQLQAQVNGTAVEPLLSTASNPVYYYVESAFNGTSFNNTTKNYTGRVLYYSTLTSNRLVHDTLKNVTDIQSAHWTITNETGTPALKNRSASNFIVGSRDASTISVSSLMTRFIADNQYAILNSDATGSYMVAWTTTTTGKTFLKADRLSPNWMMKNNSTAFYFIVVPGYEKNQLLAKINQTNTLLTSVSEGTTIGKPAVGSKAALITAVQNAQNVYDNNSATATECLTAANNLTLATQTFKSSVILPQISTSGSDIWYYIKGNRPGNSTYVSARGTSIIPLPATNPSDSMLWKIVANTSGSQNGYTLVNKISGAYLSVPNTSKTSLSTSTTMSVTNLKLYVSNLVIDSTFGIFVEDIANGAASSAFRMYNGLTNIINNYDNSNDINGAWSFIPSTNNVNIEFLKTNLLNAKSLYAESKEGNDFGQYSTSNRILLNNAIVAAQSALSSTLTDLEYTNANTDLVSAINSYKTSMNINPVSLISVNSNNYRWYVIKNAATSVKNRFEKGLVLSAGSRAAAASYTFEPKSTDPTDAQLFRFELNADQTKVINIYNKKGYYVSAAGLINATSVTGVDYIITPFADGLTVKIKPGTSANFAILETTNSINNLATANFTGSEDSWILEYVSETPKVITSTSQIDSKYKVFVNNRIITVEGVKSYEIYSVTGQCQALNVSLQQGVYIVKSPEFTTKVMVK